MPGRSGWGSGLGDSSRGGDPSAEEAHEQRRAARTVAAAAVDPDDLRELLEMLGLDHLPRDPATSVHDSAPDSGAGHEPSDPPT